MNFARIVCAAAVCVLTTLTISAAEPAKTTPQRPPVHKRPALEDPQSWTMIVVPDTQVYSQYSHNNGILDLMLTWILRNQEYLRIQQVLFTGDLVDSNDGRYTGSDKNRLVGREAWDGFSRLMERLDGRLPYILATGNHDFGHARSADNRDSFFAEYFPTDRNPLTRRQLLQCAPNAFGYATLQNSAYEFTAPHPDNRKFLVIVLQFAPTDEDLAWAKEIADDPRFENHIGILLTHSYLAWTGQRLAEEKYVLNKQGGNAGEGIFQKLVRPAKNIRLVVCGHIAKPDTWERGIAFSVDQNESGKSVAQMAFNTQAIGGGWAGNGGDGWLRILEFMPDGKTVKARTFSPLFAASPSTRHLAWKFGPRDEFSFEID